MCERRASVDSLKSAPRNKIALPIDEVAEYFKTHSLGDCAERYNCSTITIKRQLRAIGIDTSIHNHSMLAINRSAVAMMLGKVKPSADELYKLLIEDNLDTKTIAERYNLHFNTIRNIARHMGLRKTPKQVSASMMRRHMLRYGVNHPAQRPDVLAKTSISLNKAKYHGNSFKSLTELGYALFLDANGLKWYYEEMHVPYVDMMTGKRRIYVIDFTVVDGDAISWIEVKPNNLMIPEDKRIYASRRAEETGIIYRGLFDDERTKLWHLITTGYRFDEIEFIHQTPRSTCTKITYYFKHKTEAINFMLDGWRQFTKPTNDGMLWKKILVKK